MGGSHFISSIAHRRHKQTQALSLNYLPRLSQENRWATSARKFRHICLSPRAAPDDSSAWLCPCSCRADTAAQPGNFPFPQPKAHGSSAAGINHEQQTENKNKAKKTQTNKSKNTFISYSLIFDGSLRCLLVAQMTSLCSWCSGCWTRPLAGLLFIGSSWEPLWAPRQGENSPFPPHSSELCPVTRESWGHPAGDDIPLAPLPSHTELIL